MQLVFVHGFGCSAADWSAQLEALSSFADVTAVELQRVTRPATGSLIVEMAERVNSVRRNSGLPRAVLIGHSMGCRVALEAARRLPDAIEGLVLIEGSLRAVGDAAEAVSRYLSRSAEENKTLLMRDFSGMFSDATPAAFRESVLRRTDGMSSDYSTQLMADMTFWDAAEASSALKAVRVPTLVLQSTYKEPGGERRPIGPVDISPWLRLVAEQTSGWAQIVRLANLGHFPQVESPALINHAIADFVSSLYFEDREKA